MHRLAILSFGAVLLFCGVAARAATLREQLALAQKAEDTYAEIELIRRILEKEPADGELRGDLINLWFEVGDYDMGERALKEWKDAPEDWQAFATAEILFKRDGKKAEAVEILEKYRAKDPADLDITRQLAGFLETLAENEKLIVLLAQAPGADQEADLLVQRALARRTLQDFAGAQQDFAKAQAVDSSAYPVVNNRAAFERLQTALPHIRKSTEILAKDPENFTARIARAFWYAYLGFASELAMEDAQKARELNPKASTALLLYAISANNAGKLSTAKAREELWVDVSKTVPPAESFDQLLNLDIKIAQNPQDAALWAGRSFVLNDAPAQYRLALQDADTALKIAPKSIEAHTEKIFALVKLGRSSEALAELSGFEAMKPAPAKLASVLSYLTEAAFTASEFPRALDYATRAIKARPTAHYYRQRSAILQRMNRAQEAEADLAKAKQLDKKP